jgi:LPPG:FO 2-phospho-L-lactate transferase
VGLPPIFAGARFRALADACLPAIGVETTAAAAARHYGPRSCGGLIDGWLGDVVDRDLVGPLVDAGFACRAVPLLMHDVTATAAMAREALDLGATLP